MPGQPPFRHRSFSAVLLAVAAFVGGCKTSPPPSATILAITDFHGALDPATSLVGEFEARAGGAEQFAGAIALLRDQADAPTFLIDAGDLFSGTMISNVHEGEPVIEFYNFLGVDAAAVGNHEFDYGPRGPNAVVRFPGEHPRGAIQARAAEAQFPFLAVNIDPFDPEAEAGWYRESALIERDGVTVGVVGATSRSTPSTTIAQNLIGLAIADSAAARIEAVATRLRDDGADFVVVTIHDGGICTNRVPVEYPTDHEALAELCSETEIFEILDRLPAGLVDVVVAGHTHQQVLGTYRGIAVVQPPAKGKAIGAVTVGADRATEVHPLLHVCDSYFDGDTTRGCDSRAFEGSEPPSHTAAAEYGGIPLGPDDRVAGLLAPFRERVRARAAEPVGIAVDAELTRSFLEECSLGNFSADLLRRAAKADVAIINNGGLRANIAAGPLTYGDIYAVLPFDNRLATVEVSGEQLVAAIELGASGRQEFYSFSGVTARLEDGAVVDAEVAGQPVEPGRRYLVAYSDFLAGGGSGFDGLRWPAARIWWERAPMRDLIFEAARELAPAAQPIAPEQFFGPESARIRQER